MNDTSNITNLPTAKKPEPKLRTITLTNRAPVQIVEDQWPVIAQGGTGEDWYSDSGWSIKLRVRENQWGQMIIHGNFELTDETNENAFQTVRVGRMLSSNDASRDLWKHMLEVAEEMRVRISNERLHRNVTVALDQCFASLAPARVSG